MLVALMQPICNKETIWRLVLCGSWVHMFLLMRWNCSSFFTFDNVWVLIHALEGFYKHIGIGICSFKLPVYFIYFQNPQRALFYLAVFHAFEIWLVNNTCFNPHVAKCIRLCLQIISLYQVRGWAKLHLLFLEQSICT